MDPPKIIIAARACIELSTESGQIPDPGGLAEVHDAHWSFGGKGGVQSVVATRLGAKTMLIARLGTDWFGNQAAKFLKKEGICDDYIFRDANRPTGINVQHRDFDGNQLHFSYPGANALLSVNDIQAAGKEFEDAACVITSLGIPKDALLEIADLAEKHEIPLILDPEPAPPTPLSLLFMRYVRCIVPGRLEGERLTGIKISDRSSAQKVIDKLLLRGVRYVVLYLENEGFLFSELPGRCVHFPFSLQNWKKKIAPADMFCGALGVGFGKSGAFSEAVPFAIRAMDRQGTF